MQIKNNENKKYFGNAVKAILDMAEEKCCVYNDEEAESIARLLNTAIDMAFMYDLKQEFNLIFKTCASINSALMKKSIYRRGYRFFAE